MFGVGKGLVIFHPDELRDNPRVPPIVVTGFKLFNEPVGIGPNTPLRTGITETKLLELAHTQNTVLVEFAALDYTSPANNQYAYMLEGLETDWNYVGMRRDARYTNLPPGDYLFRVKGSNNDGVWNERWASLRIIITPPWWKTNWAYAGCVTAILGLLYSIRRFERNRERLKHQAQLEHVEAANLWEVDQLKSRFFANILHEFRTPLTLILGPVEKWNQRVQDEELRKDLGMMHPNARRLLRLINQLLDISKLEAGSMKLQASAGNIVPFAKGIAHSFESVAANKNITLGTESDSDNIELYFDRDKMEKILSNLLSNPFKFTAEGGSVSLSLRGVPRSGTTKQSDNRNEIASPPSADRNDMKGYVEITISDTGLGIDGTNGTICYAGTNDRRGTMRRAMRGWVSVCSTTSQLQRGMHRKNTT